MRIVQKCRQIWQRTLQAAEHPRAHGILSVVSFLDSCVLPVSPWMLLLPMCLAQPKRSWWYVTTCSFFGMGGAMVGYVMGHYLFGVLSPYLHEWGYWDRYQHIVLGLQDWGLWMLWVAVLVPIPYKLFAIGSGFVGLPFVAFSLITFVVRWLHFAVIPLVVCWGSTYPLFRRFCYLPPPK